MSGPGGRNYMRRRDATEKVCVRTFEKLGCTVWKVDEPMDLLVWLPGHGYEPVEVKSPGGRLTQQQLEMPDLEVVFNPMDVADLVSKWRGKLPQP